ncbi:MAG: VIT domain-containing protein [Stenotrophomonas sp.]
MRAQKSGDLAAPQLLLTQPAELPVQLRSADLHAYATAGQVETVVELEFFNPNARVLEGNLQFPLDAAQQVVGFALDIDGRMRDAVPVPKARGRQVFEAIARRGVDPGLLEQTAGNQFQLRIYPIPAHGSRKVRIVYREMLPRVAGSWAWKLPLQFAKGAARASLHLEMPVAPAADRSASFLKLDRREGGCVARWQGAANRLPAQVLLTLPELPGPLVSIGDGADGRYFVAQVPVEDIHSARVLPRRIGLLWDASGSAGKRDHEAELALLERYFAAVGDARVDLTVLRNHSQPARRFIIREGEWAALRQALGRIQPDGASALAAWTPDPAVEEYLLVSDGLINYGPRDFPALAPGQRLFALNSAGVNADQTWLAAIAEARGGRLVDCADLTLASQHLLHRGGELLSMGGQGVADLVADSRFANDGYLRIHGRLTSAAGSLDLVLGTASSERRLAVPVAGPATPGTWIASAWAQAQLRTLAADPQRNAAAMTALAQRFGIVTAQSSLIVLEDAADYARYDIAPPLELRAAVERLREVRQQDVASAKQRRLEQVVSRFAQQREWWQHSWPKGTPPTPVGEVSAVAMEMAMTPPPMPSPAAVDAAPQAAAEVAQAAPVAAARRSPPSPPSPAAPAPIVTANNAGATIQLTVQPWQPDSAYARRLRAAAADEVYPLYLLERAAHADSSAFYLDVADILFEHGQRDLGLRVLSNLAELQLENRHVLRVLGYRLLQAGAADEAVQVFTQVLRLGEEEPQSFRDLGLAFAAAGQPQAAIGPLYEVVARDWDRRFDGIALIALAELNNIVARAPTRLDTSSVDPRLLHNLPLDLRVVLGWDSDNSDMDLWVTDPNGERCYYGNRNTWQGGRLSEDFTGGYGPEEFALRQAKPGRYKVEANFFGDRQQLVTGATSLNLRLSTRWGSRAQRDQQITLRLKDRSETVLVGEFEVK